MPLCSEAASGYCCDPGLRDQTKAERLGAKAEGTDIREGIKRALRDGAAQLQFIGAVGLGGAPRLYSAG